MTDELKSTTKNYLMAMAWWHLYATDENTPMEKIEKARLKIEASETKLRELGVTEEGIKELGDRAEKFIHTPADQMTHNQLETFHQLIFGPKAKFEPENISYMMDAQGKALRGSDGKLIRKTS